MEVASIKGDSEDRESAKPKSSHLKYVRKPFFGSSHSWALGHLLSLDRSASILDIGAGSGFLGETLREQGFASVDGVEVDSKSRVHIKDFYSRLFASLSEAESSGYDVIVLLDVLEHTPVPEDFLREALLKLKPGGRILISVPNIAHWSVRFSLLFGFFTYTERGLLDKTHLQFFTRKRLREITTASGLKTFENSASIEPIELLLPEWTWKNPFFALLSRIRLFVAKVFPGLFAFQHLNLSVK